jgi:hypothetical protein
MLDQQATHTELDSVALVSRGSLLPKRFRHDAEHCSAVELLTASLDRVNGERANFAALYERRGRRHARISGLRTSTFLVRMCSALTLSCRA